MFITTASSLPVYPERDNLPMEKKDNTFEKRIFNAVIGLTGYLPTRKERANTTKNATGRTSIPIL